MPSPEFPRQDQEGEASSASPEDEREAARRFFVEAMTHPPDWKTEKKEYRALIKEVNRLVNLYPDVYEAVLRELWGDKFADHFVEVRQHWKEWEEKQPRYIKTPKEILRSIRKRK